MEATGILQIDEMLYGEVHSAIGNMLMFKRPKARYIETVPKMSMADVMTKLDVIDEGSLEGQRTVVLFYHGDFGIKECFKVMESRLMRSKALLCSQSGRRYAHLHP